MNTQLNLSEDLKHFKFIPGENVVIVAPDPMCGYSPTDIIGTQLAANLAWNNPGQVLYIYGRRSVAEIHIAMIKAMVAQNTPDYSFRIEHVLRGVVQSNSVDEVNEICSISKRIMNKVQLKEYKECAEDDNGGVAAYIKKLVERAGMITAVVVDNLDGISAMNGLQREVKQTHENGNVTITYTREEHHQAYQRRLEVITALGEIAKEKNIPCICTYTTNLSPEEFRSCKSLGRRTVIGWDSNKMKEHVDRLYGITADCHPLFPEQYPQPLQKLTEYVVNTQQINTHKILNLSYGYSKFSCLDEENCLDIFV